MVYQSIKLRKGFLEKCISYFSLIFSAVYVLINECKTVLCEILKSTPIYRPHLLDTSDQYSSYNKINSTWFSH